MKIQIIKSFVTLKHLNLMVPTSSRLRAVNRMRVNEFTTTLQLSTLNIEGVLVPKISESDKKMGESFNNIESSINNEDDVLFNVLKYSFVIRYLSNNQAIVYSSLFDSYLPLNLHLSSQALSSGMKPQSEKYQSNKPELKAEYETLFTQKLENSEIESSPPLIKKLYLSGYTNNILVNDPFFSQMFLVYCLILLIILIFIVKSVIFRR